MRTDIKVSCIIPIFNSGDYLLEALQSLRMQTLTEIEILCVNDASNDNSLEILETLKCQDKRIKVINNSENMGAAISRNIGMDIAQGEYLIFLDSDDYFFKDMLELAYENAKQYEADVVIFGYEQVQVECEKKNCIANKVNVVNNFQVLKRGERGGEYIRTIGHGAWNKLICKKVIDRFGIKFQNIETNNDLYFSMAVSLAADKVVICDKVLMRYYMGRKGSVTQFRRKKKQCRVMAFEHLLEFLEREKVEDIIEKELYNYMIYMFECDFDDEYNSLECKEGIESQIFQSKIFNEKIRDAYNKGQLYRHAQIFAEKMLRKESLKECKFYEYYMPQVKELVIKSKMANEKIAVWGCGVIGKKIVYGMDINGLKADYLIDMDYRKQNLRYGKYVICTYESVKDNVKTILVTSHKHYKEIKEIAKGKVVINLYNDEINENKG